MKVLKYVGPVLLLAFLATPLMAGPVSIDPTSGVIDVTRWEGNETSQNDINDIVEGITGYATELYKNDVGEGDSGALASNYTTVYNGDLSGGTITWDGGAFVSPIAYLLVKDGAQTPAWYLFNLTALGWDGQSTITLSDFWPAQGAISHVALYGTQGTTVPEPGTLTLLGLGLLAGGFAWRRRK